MYPGSCSEAASEAELRAKGQDRLRLEAQASGDSGLSCSPEVHPRKGVAPQNLLSCRGVKTRPTLSLRDISSPPIPPLWVKVLSCADTVMSHLARMKRAITGKCVGPGLLALVGGRWVRRSAELRNKEHTPAA